MLNHDSAKEIIFNSIDAINLQLPSNKRIIKHQDTVLVGDHCDIDSLSLINLIVEVEENLNIVVGKRVSILEEGLMSDDYDTFSTISELADWIVAAI